MTSLSENTVVTTSGGLVELGYSQITSAVTVDNATYGTGKEIFSPITVVCDGSPIVIEFFSQNVYSSSATSGDTFDLALWVDGVEQDRYWARRYQNSTVSSTFSEYMYVSRRLTPTAGVHTFSVRGVSYPSAARPFIVNAGVGGASQAVPSFLRISKVIQASQFIVPLASAPLVTSLPSAPIDGQEIRYVADATNGVIWNLRYRAASSSPYKWEFIGGPPVTTVSPVYPASQSNSSYTNITSGPTFTVPISGDYIVNHWGNVDIYSPVQERILLMCPATATFGASDVYAGKVGADFTTGGIQRTYWRAETTMTSLTANETITIQQKYAVGALTAVFFYCGLSIIPRRLG